MKEIWKTRSDLNNVYISNLGRYKYSEHGYPKQNKGNSRNGYVKIMINKKNFTMHRLVAELFINQQCKSKNLVDHINGLRDDNSIINLRWVNHSENNKNKRFDGVFMRSHLYSFIEEKNNLINTFNEMNKKFNDAIEKTDLIHESIKSNLQLWKPTN